MKGISESLRLYFFSLFFQSEKKKDEELAIAHRSLIQGTSFDLPYREHHSPLIALKVAGRLLRWLFQQGKKKKPYMQFEGERNGIAVFDAKEGAAEQRLPYLRFFADEAPAFFIAREHLGKEAGLAQRLQLAFWILLLTPLLLFQKRSKGNKALILNEWVQGLFLFRAINEQRVEKLHSFCIYEKDQNLLAYWLKRHGVHVNKITADPPLAFYNRRILADSLSLCHPYQEEEVSCFPDIRTDEFEVWGPERILDYIGQLSERNDTYPYRLAFYSNGVWLRKEEGHPDPGFGNFRAEEEVLDLLGEWMKETDETIRIYLHPKEKTDGETFDRAKAYYQEALGERIALCQAAGRSASFFHEAEVGVGGFSGSMMERLFAGYKVLFYAFPLEGFPLQGSPIEAIAPGSREAFLERMKELLSRDGEAFFRKYDLDRYKCPEALKEGADRYRKGEASR
ncbi:MAG: hypothetical protein ABEH38_05920 [Flavobacteriales bacterium]